MGTENTRSSGRTPEERAFIEWYRQQPKTQKSAICDLFAALTHREEKEPEFSYTETGAVLCADTVSVEADAIRVFARLMCNEWQETDLNREQLQELYFAIYGLEMLITTHADHARKLADICF